MFLIYHRMIKKSYDYLAHVIKKLQNHMKLWVGAFQGTSSPC